MSRVFWGTNLFIYALEGSGPQCDAARRLFERMSERRDELITSALTLGEVLVRPLASGTAELAGRYEKWFSSPGVRLVPFDIAAARLYAVLRRDRSIKAPDAIQLACAGATGVNLFITNDLRLSRKIAPGVDFIVPLAQAFF